MQTHLMRVASSIVVSLLVCPLGSSSAWATSEGGCDNEDEEALLARSVPPTGSIAPRDVVPRFDYVDGGNCPGQFSSPWATVMQGPDVVSDAYLVKSAVSRHATLETEVLWEEGLEYAIELFGQSKRGDQTGRIEFQVGVGASSTEPSSIQLVDGQGFYTRADSAATVDLEVWFGLANPGFRSFDIKDAHSGDVRWTWIPELDGRSTVRLRVPLQEPDIPQWCFSIIEHNAAAVTVARFDDHCVELEERSRGCSSAPGGPQVLWTVLLFALRRRG